MTAGGCCGEVRGNGAAGSGLRRIGITMEIYTEEPSTATRDALRKLGQWLEDTQT